MFRALTEDHVLFEEAVEAFRPNSITRDFFNDHYKEEGRSLTYLFSSFKIEEELICTNFKISRSKVFKVSRISTAYISEVTVPEWSQWRHNHLFAIAVSAVLTFVCQLPTKGPRGYLYTSSPLDDLSDDQLLLIASEFPIKLSETYYNQSSIPNRVLKEIQLEILELTSILYNLPYEDFKNLIRAVRLVQLAQNTLREDFALGYFLLVSAIESVAQLAISRDNIKVANPQEAEWKAMANTDPEIKKLYVAYKDARGQNSYLKERFIKFILNYCPITEWIHLQSKEYFNVQDDELLRDGKLNWILEKRFGDIYPDDLTEVQIKKLLEDSYAYRSKFTHRGQSPPHQIPTSRDRFFEKGYLYDKDGAATDILLPTFRLMSFIAKQSILNFYRSKIADIKNTSK